MINNKILCKSDFWHWFLQEKSVKGRSITWVHILRKGKIEPRRDSWEFLILGIWAMTILITLILIKKGVYCVALLLSLVSILSNLPLRITIKWFIPLCLSASALVWCFGSIRSFLAEYDVIGVYFRTQKVLPKVLPKQIII